MIDLHVHSIMSDGTYSPSEIAKLAYEKNIRGFALTDHDSIAGNEEARISAKVYNVDFLNGIEMSLAYDNHQIHVVALGFDSKNSAFLQYYTKLRKNKKESIHSVVDYLKKQGLDISIEKVQRCATNKEIDKYSIMRYLIKLFSVTGSVQPLWDKYLDPAFKNLQIKENPPAEYAIDCIHKAGGVTSLAHFHKKIGFLGYNRDKQEYHIKYLHDMGLDGMEAFYPNYSKDDEAFADYLIKKYKLLPTGGTDFHGKNRPAVELGTGIKNNINVPYSFFEDIYKKINTNR